MANLVSQANRLNDVEINNNKPVTSQVFRRIGSSINFLLDLVDANDGDTATAGSLGTILTPKEVVSFGWSAGSYATGTTTDLFTFQGDLERHLSWVQKSSDYCISTGGTLSSQATIQLFDPITRILQTLNSQITSGGLGAGDRARITVNGVTFGSVFYSGGPTGVQSITQTLNLKCAQAGSNVVRLFVPTPQAAGIVLSSSTFQFEKIFI